MRETPPVFAWFSCSQDEQRFRVFQKCVGPGQFVEGPAASEFTFGQTPVAVFDVVIENDSSTPTAISSRKTKRRQLVIGPAFQARSVDKLGVLQCGVLSISLALVHLRRRAAGHGMSGKRRKVGGLDGGSNDRTAWEDRTTQPTRG